MRIGRRSPSWAIGLLAGAACAAAIACGGAMRSKAAAPPTASQPGLVREITADRKAQIEALDSQITADLAELKLPRPPVSADACITPPCDPVAMTDGAVAPTAMADPLCTRSASETCTSSCKLSDSICDSSTKICKIAADLGGQDEWANGKCASGKSSCTASRERCCGCG